MTHPTHLIDTTSTLIRPTTLSVDGTLPADRARHLVRTAQLLYTFWNTGDPGFLDDAVDASFVDHTIPPGRPEGRPGLEAASTRFRAAVPDLTCEIADLLVFGDRFAVRLQFRGTFTGTYNGVAGSGQQIDFVAFDIQHVGDVRIDQDWHLEDNLTFLTQAGLVTIAGT